MPDREPTIEPVTDGMVTAVRDGILTWFGHHQRDLPWRHSRDPYRVLVAEVMLQQTQVDRVIPYYQRFMEEYPAVADLAAAPVAAVIRLWAGLGYNRRAVNLHRAAQAVMRDHGGVFPARVSELKSLPGVGDYTAGAIACFAFEQDVPFLDTNMSRVVRRVFVESEKPAADASAGVLHGIAGRLVPVGDGWRWNQALMEFGALHCTSRQPLCVLCPIQTQCRSFASAQSTIGNDVRTAPGEQPFAGSNRYYRGRVLDVLRALPDQGAGMSLETLGKIVRPDFTSEHLPWLDTLVRALQRDGLAHVAEPAAAYDAVSAGEIRVTLP